MKRIILIFVITFTVLLAKAQIVNIPDANFKQALIDRGVDTNDDGEIQESEALALTSLRVSRKNIVSLEGIEEFINLDYLDCSNNELTELDVSGLTKLTYFYCYSNQLTSLNVSNLVNLVSLDCGNSYSGGNLLTSLDVSALTNLERLRCSNNQLTSLDVSGLTELTSLRCSNNQLTTLDVSGLANLDFLSCNDNKLITLNISNLPNLDHLECQNNTLKSLDVSNFNYLDYLDCSNNQLTSLMVLGTSGGLNLNCSNNQLTSLELPIGTGDSLHFDCSDNDLSSLFIKDLDLFNERASDFSGNPNLKYICAKKEHFSAIQNKVSQYGYQNVVINDYCSFTPGGEFYIIEGSTKFDSDGNGCDGSDPSRENFKFDITDGNVEGTIISDPSGNYLICLSVYFPKPIPLI